MTDDDLEPRLRRMLSGRASQVDPALDGPTLRARATDRPGIAQRAAAPLLIAAAVAVIAIVAQIVSSHPGDGHRQPPGVSVSVPRLPSTPAPRPSPTSPSPSVPMPSTPRSPAISASSTLPVAPTPPRSFTPSVASTEPPSSQLSATTGA